MRHKHADTIIAWANGAIIETRNDPGIPWSVSEHPNWSLAFEYRVKPKEKEKVYQYAYMSNSGALRVTSGHYRSDSSFLNAFVTPPRWFVRLDPSMLEIDKE